MLPDSDDLEGKVKVPLDVKGQDYLDYVLQAQEFEEEQRQNKVHELGELLSAKRILAEDPVLGMHQQKMMRGNLMEQALNKSKDFPTRRNNKKGTLINANLTRISLASKKSFDISLYNNTKEGKEIVNISDSKDVFIEENSFPKISPSRVKSKEPNILNNNSVFKDTSLDGANNILPNQKRGSSINENSELINFETFKSSTLKGNDISLVQEISKSPIKNPEESLNKNLSKLQLFTKEIGPAPPNKEIDGGVQKRNIDKNPADSNGLPNLSYLEGGLLAVPDLQNLKPGLLDGFED